MTILERAPATQYQIGDAVVYLPEGVVSIIGGYVWLNTVGALPTIIAYMLLAGCSAPAEALRRAVAGVDFGRETVRATEGMTRQ